MMWGQEYRFDQTVIESLRLQTPSSLMLLCLSEMLFKMILHVLCNQQALNLSKNIAQLKRNVEN